MSHSNNTGGILGSLIVGALAGAVAALLLAPQSGKETRGKLKAEAEKLREELKRYADDFSEKAQQAKADLEEKLKRTEEELKNANDFGV